MPELLIVEDRTYERADARWLRLRCTDPDCMVVEVRFEPADSAEHLVDAMRKTHAQLHAEIERQVAAVRARQATAASAGEA